MRVSSVTEDSAVPVIGIFSSMLVMESGLFPGMERSFVNHDYISAVEAAGGVPIMLPVVKSDAVIRRQVESVDAVILTGGYDPSPLAYGENPGRLTEFIFPEIDEHQLKAIRVADELGKPMLGICRGMQMLNIAFGGTLYQDLTFAPNSYIQHYQKSRRHSPGHQVEIKQNTILAEVFGEPVILTNSFHHLALKDIAPGFIVSARAPDGIVEGIERREGTPVTAVQWHPEMMFEKHPVMLGLFRTFIEIVNGRNELESRKRTT
ncbi:MAG: gamma-glutamyl-gamma-aminobutyrate hydrolase family protein [Treponemataceae bacterium]